MQDLGYGLDHIFQLNFFQGFSFHLPVTSNVVYGGNAHELASALGNK